ncbi:MAG TPA: hypothetical protein VI461_06815, partial [Chitinophagaceae bacterium]|nr:hypothetical protein [Chitinophagaceae bacterium]
LNSPLLNDSDIRGAKWILININSAEGENEFTMDEVEVIQSHLITQAGEGTDVILGLGYDNNLGNKLGITLIATGFEHKDPFVKKPRPEPKKEEKIVMILGQPEETASSEIKAKEDKKTEVISTLSKVVKMNKKEATLFDTTMEKVDPLAPRLVEEVPDVPMPDMNDLIETEHIKEAEPALILYLRPEEKILSKIPVEDGIITGGKMFITEKDEDLHSLRHQSLSLSVSEHDSIQESVSHKTIKEKIPSQHCDKVSTTPVSAASGGYLARPSNIYAESKTEADASTNSAEKPVPPSYAANEEEELLDLQMQLIERDDIPAADKPLAHQAQPPLTTEAEEPAMRDEAEEQKRRAAERLHKLRNLSFNVTGSDPNNEFDTVPAYIRRNMELYNSSSHIENFYSNYEVKTDADNKTEISTINTFLDGKKPD